MTNTKCQESGTIKSVTHRRPTLNPMTDNGSLVGDIVIETDDGQELAICVPLESVIGPGKSISVYRGSDGECLIDRVEELTAVEMFPWLGDDFDRGLGKFVDKNGVPI